MTFQCFAFALPIAPHRRSRSSSLEGKQTQKSKQELWPEPFPLPLPEPEDARLRRQRVSPKQLPRFCFEFYFTLVSFEPGGGVEGESAFGWLCLISST